MDPELKAAVADAYRAFSRYGLGGRIEVDRGVDGVGPLEERLLVLTPLDEIPAELLAVYTDSPHAWNDGKVAGDFRALLPRYFELIADRVFPTTGRQEETLRRLAEAEYRTKWQSDEVEAIERFFAALLNAALARKLEDDIALVVGLVKAAGGSIESFLSTEGAGIGVSRPAD